MANDNGYPRLFLTVLLFVSSGFGGVPEGVKKSGLEPSSAQGPLRRVCEAILVPKQADRLLKNEIWGWPGGVRGGAGGIIRGFKIYI